MYGQLPPTPFINQNLFSDWFLINRLPGQECWNIPNLEELHSRLSLILEEFLKVKIDGNEDSTCDDFINKVLDALGFAYHRKTSAGTGFPDYALFSDLQSKIEAARHYKTSKDNYYRNAVTVLEAKYWDRKLDNQVLEDKFDTSDASGQIVRYLTSLEVYTENRIQWGILTNGHLWRLYWRRARSKTTNYYQVDLSDLIANPHGSEVPGAFFHLKYFLILFSPAAFITDPATGKNRLDLIAEGSEKYAVEVSENLREKIFAARDGIFISLAKGFMDIRKARGQTSFSDADMDEIFRGALTLLYRLLFLFYAESRELLPADRLDYYRYSLRKICNETYDIVKGGASISEHAADLWSGLRNLFAIVDKGDKGLGIPAYNGGLFDEAGNSFFAENSILDAAIAAPLYAMTWNRDQRIDYKSLGVDQLGSIYEGLLEFKLRIADKPLFAVRNRGGGEVWADSPRKGLKTVEKIEPGDVYLINDKSERKASGSFYTPDMIVRYIVANTLKPVMEQRFKVVEEILAALHKAWKKLKKTSVPGSIRIVRGEMEALEQKAFETLFGIKVLDPAMGSGHFLVKAVDFLADGIITFLASDRVKNILEGKDPESPRNGRRSSGPENPVIAAIHRQRDDILKELKSREIHIDPEKLTDNNLIKRTVMKRCIYGVDLNPMAVELSKVSLWLDSFTLGAPLSFLDHHIKCGNSLIGAFEVEKFILEGSPRFDSFQKAVRELMTVAELTDSTMDEVRQSKRLFEEADGWLRPFRKALNVHVAKHFVSISEALLYRIAGFAFENGISSADDVIKERKPEYINYLESQASAEEHWFFHWKLEFPEVWFGPDGKPLEDSGFDIVMGNPPYGNVIEKSDCIYFSKYYRTFEGVKDFYALFIEKSICHAKQNGTLSFIVPSAWLGGPRYIRLRELILSNRINTLILLPYDIFKEAYIDTVIFVVQKDHVESNQINTYVYGKRERLENINLSENEYDRVNQDDLMQTTNKKIILRSSTLHLLKKIGQSNLVTIGDFIEVKRGVLFDKGLLTARKTSANSFLYFEGDVYRYQLNFVCDNWIDLDNELKERPKEACWFTNERILLRRLVNRRQRLMATYINKPFVTNKNIYSVLVKTANIHFILGILNSRLLSYLYINQITQAEKDDFPQVTIIDICALPFPSHKNCMKYQKEMVAIVKRVLSLSRSLGKAKSETEKDKIQNEIDITDKRIDELVYKLYGLSDEEIAIVEGEK